MCARGGYWAGSWCSPPNTTASMCYWRFKTRSRRGAKRKKFSIPGLAYESAGGFVSEVCREAAYACWNVLKFDNARAHLAEDTLTTLCEFVGCRVDAGPVRKPTQRPFIERFFRTLTDRLSRRLPGTTGNQPKDAAGKKGKKQPVEHLVTIQELEVAGQVALYYPATRRTVFPAILQLLQLEHSNRMVDTACGPDTEGSTMEIALPNGLHRHQHGPFHNSIAQARYT